MHITENQEIQSSLNFKDFICCRKTADSLPCRIVYLRTTAYVSVWFISGVSENYRVGGNRYQASGVNLGSTIFGILGFRVSGLGFKFYSIWDLGFRVSGLGFRFYSISDLGFRV